MKPLLDARSWVRRHPLGAYFLLAYGITWGGIALVLALEGFGPVTPSPGNIAVIAALMLVGPCISGLLLTAGLDGRAGMREMWCRFAHWRIGWPWAAIALLTLPLLVLAVLGPLSVWVDPVFAPRFRLELFAIGLVAGAFEEIGWTGFATPRLLARRAAGLAGLQLGVLWAVWHAAADLASHHATMGARWWLWFAVFWLATLPAYRVLMTCVYAHTRSLSWAMLMHASYTGWLFVMTPSTGFEQGLVWQGLLALGLWLAAIAVWRARDRVAPPGPQPA